MEVELKLLLAPADNPRLIAHPLIAAHARAPVRKADLSAHYFDTPDLHLMRHGAGLRVRKMDGNWVQTMKAGGSAQSGLHQRNEWESVVSQAWPQLGKLRKAVGTGSKWHSMLNAPGLKDRLEVLFAVIVERRTWDLDYQGSQIELVLDQGHIERLGRRDAINEIELELKSGDPAHLFEFALRLLDDIPLRLSNASKAERGYALCRDTGTIIARAAPVKLEAGASAAQALIVILSNCLEQIQGNEQAVLDTDNSEAVHQMRVGVRRLRSALKLFEDAAACPPPLLDETSWLGEQLGGARDWEVLRESTLARVQGNPGLMELQSLVTQTAHTKRSQAAQALLSPRYTRLQLSLGMWMQQLSSASNDTQATQAAADFAHHTIRRLRKKMRRRAEAAADGDERAVHRLRIASKRLRYAVEFFSSLYRQKSSTRFIDRLSDVQDALGLHNDVAVADRLLHELQEQHPRAAASVAYARGYLQALQAEGDTQIGELRHMVRTLELPRRA